VIITRDAARTYGVTRLVRRCRGLLGGVVTAVTAVAGMLCVITFAFGVVGVGGGGSSETESAGIPSELVRGWLLLLAVFITGWVAGSQLRRGRRSLVLWLRRFRYGDATRVVTTALGHVGRSWRVVTLDDRATEPVGVAGGLRWADAFLTYAWLVVRVVAKWAVRIGKVARYVAVIGIVAMVGLTLVQGGLEGLSKLLEEVFAPSRAMSSAATILLLSVGILVLEFVILLAYIVVLLLVIPFIGVGTLVGNIRGGVRSAESDKLRTIDTLSDARAAVSQMLASSQRPLAARLTVLDVDSSVWRDTVVAFARASSAVVIDVSKPSEHLAWEVEQVQAGRVRQIFVGHLDLVTPLATGGEVSVEDEDTTSVDRLRQLLEGEVVLAYTTGWLGRWRFRRSLYGALEAARTPLPWDRRRVVRLLAGTAGLVLWFAAIDSLVDLVLAELPS
jgi:hypothetical protein